MNIYIIAAIIFILSIVAARIINERGLKLLSTEEKGLLVQALLALSKYQLIFLALIIGLYFLVTKLFPENMSYIMAAYFSLLIILMFVHGVAISKKLQQYAIPKSYTRTYILSTFVKTGGMILTMALLFYNVRQ